MMIDAVKVTDVEEMMTRPVINALEKSGFEVIGRDRQKLKISTGEKSPIIYVLITRNGVTIYRGSVAKVATSFFDIGHIVRSVQLLIS